MDNNVPPSSKEQGPACKHHFAKTYYPTIHPPVIYNPRNDTIHQLSSRPSSLPLAHLAHLLLPLLLQKLLLRLGIQRRELGVALGLLGLLLRDLALLGLFLLAGLLDGLDGVLADGLDLAHDLGAELADGGQLVGYAEEVGEYGEEAGVVV